MATSYLFGAGTLTYGTTDIPVQNVSYEETAEVIELYANKSFPVAAAIGKKSVKGSFTVAGYEATLLSSMTNTEMGPITSEVSLTWVLPAQGGTSVTFKVENIILGSKKLASGNDKFLTMDVSYTGLASATAEKVVTITSA